VSKSVWRASWRHSENGKVQIALTHLMLRTIFTGIRVGTEGAEHLRVVHRAEVLGLDDALMPRIVSLIVLRCARR
jgi:hypothetical protein